MVEKVGAAVATVKPGNHVVACLSGFCGSCPQCLSGHPNLCTGGIVTRPDDAAPRLSQNGRPLRQFIGISSYAEKMLLHENSVVRIERIAIVGTAGSGKTYAAKGFVERLIETGAHVTIVDPLGVWRGLRARNNELIESEPASAQAGGRRYRSAALFRE